MNKEFGRICADARRSAGITQEQAEDLLRIGKRSISDYENGKTTVPEDIVVKMMEVYNDHRLGYMYLKLTNDVGRLILPDIQPRALSGSILDLRVEMEEAIKTEMELARVGRDDVITPAEEPIFRKCVDRLKPLCGAVFAIAYTQRENRLSGNSNGFKVRTN